MHDVRLLQFSRLPVRGISGGSTLHGLGLLLSDSGSARNCQGGVRRGGCRSGGRRAECLADEFARRVWATAHLIFVQVRRERSSALASRQQRSRSCCVNGKRCPRRLRPAGRPTDQRIADEQQERNSVDRSYVESDHGLYKALAGLRELLHRADAAVSHRWPSIRQGGLYLSRTPLRSARCAATLAETPPHLRQQP